MIQIIAIIILASGATHRAKLPEPTFKDPAECQAYLESENFKTDFANLTKQAAQAFHEQFRFKISCEPSTEGKEI